MKLFDGPSEPDASLGELGSRKTQKKNPFAPSLVSFRIFFIKTLSDSLLCTLTGV